MASKSSNTKSNKIATIDEFKENYKKLGNVAAFKKGSSLPEVKPVKEVVELTYNELNQLIEKVEGLNGDDYTKESFDNLNEVLKEAKALLGAAKTQEEIDSMVSKLKDSINNLKIKEDGNGDNETPSVPGTPGNSNKPENEGSNNIENSPKTGDEFGPWGIVAISTVILGSVIMYRKRNKKVV